MNATSEPTIDNERELNEILGNTKTKVYVKGTKKYYMVGCPHKGTLRKVSSIALEKGKDDELTCKAAAAIILNTWLKTKLFYWFLWRWFFYVKEYDDYQLQDIIAESKKKLPYMNYLVNTILVTGMKDTVMTMTKKEAERIHREQVGAQPTA